MKFVGSVCESDNSIADQDGDTCASYYDASPDMCGEYDTETFVASIACCACGGGVTSAPVN